MKSVIPQWIKYPLWWVFKSPQRKLGWQTLLTDLLGLVWFFKEQTPLKAKLQPVSICVGIYNRQETFFTYFLPSLNICLNQELIELSIFDCGSDDLIAFEERLRKEYKGNFVFKSEPHSFARAFAFNSAVKQASHSLIFLCDADFSLPKNLVQMCSSYTANNGFWFPIVFYLYKNKPPEYSLKNGEWMIWGGKGLVACRKNAYWEIGGLNENYKTWGNEDEEFWLKCYVANKIIIRNKEKGLLHHWHPSYNLKYKKLEELSDLGIL
jgi:glycosyltransferase involved in cell wall biosynthesis